MDYCVFYRPIRKKIAVGPSTPDRIMLITKGFLRALQPGAGSTYIGTENCSKLKTRIDEAIFTLLLGLLKE